MALELRNRRCLRAIFPVFVGELMTAYQERADGTRIDLGKIYGNFFADSRPDCKDEVVNAVEKKLFCHLKRLGMDGSKGNASQRTVQSTIDQILGQQGVFLTGKQNEAIQVVADRITENCRKSWAMQH